MGQNQCGIYCRINIAEAITESKTILVLTPSLTLIRCHRVCVPGGLPGWCDRCAAGPKGCLEGTWLARKNVGIGPRVVRQMPSWTGVKVLSRGHKSTVRSWCGVDNTVPSRTLRYTKPQGSRKMRDSQKKNTGF